MRVSTRGIAPFLLLWCLVSPAVEAQEAEALFRFFRATPPWAAEAPGAARARLGLGLDLFVERQESLRIASQEKTLRIRDVRSGGEESTFLREDPELLNRKLDILLELEGAGSELSVPLPGVPSLNLYPSLVFQAAAADVRLDFLDRTRATDSTSYESWGLLFGTGLDLTASLCRSCPWFAGTSYRFQKIPSHGVDRSPAFRPSGFEILEDETRLAREVHELSARAGYSFPGNRIAFYAGVRHRSTTLEIDDELRYRDASGRTETHISTRTKLDSEATLALAGLEAHLAGPFYARFDTAVGDEDRIVWANVTYLVRQKRARVVSVWPTVSLLLAEGPADFKFSRNFVSVYGVMAGNWPVIVDYQLARDGFLTLTVSKEDGSRKELRLPQQGNAKAGQRQTEVVQLPADLGSELQVGLFTIQAFAASKPKKPIDFAFYGLGAGRGAIVPEATAKLDFMPRDLGSQRDAIDSAIESGSFAIDQEQFRSPGGNLSIREGDQADYSFRLLGGFNRAEIFIHRHPKRGDGFTVVAWKNSPCDTLPGICRGKWDGRDLQKNESLGRHTLQINAWEGIGNEPPWDLVVAGSVLVVP